MSVPEGQFRSFLWLKLKMKYLSSDAKLNETIFCWTWLSKHPLPSPMAPFSTKLLIYYIYILSKLKVTYFKISYNFITSITLR